MAFPRYILAPYVATPHDVVERMLDLAQLTANDRVFDLGCGDGRIAIAAARRGASALGVDCEPYWVEQATLGAQQAGVAERTEFVAGDALGIDLASASVVCLYLVHWSTQMMAHHLQAHCAPGTRVVSHSFGFEALPGTRSESFRAESGEERRIHLWTISAPAAG